MPTKRELLSLLIRDELLAALDRFDLEVADRRVKDDLVEILRASRKASLPEILSDLSRDRLKELCRALGLDDSRWEKALLVKRLAGGSTRPNTSSSKAVAEVTPPNAAPAPPAAVGAPRQVNGSSEITSCIRSVADLPRSDCQQADCGKVFLPLTVLRRLDCEHVLDSEAT